MPDTPAVQHHRDQRTVSILRTLLPAIHDLARLNINNLALWSPGCRRAGRQLDALLDMLADELVGRIAERLVKAQANTQPMATEGRCDAAA